MVERKRRDWGTLFLAMAAGVVSGSVAGLIISGLLLSLGIPASFLPGILIGAVLGGLAMLVLQALPQDDSS